jgi:hypothetical protein
MYEDGSGSTITLTTAGTWYGWVTATGGIEDGITFSSDGTADRLTVNSSGIFLGTLSVSFNGSASEVIHGNVHKSGSPTTFQFERKLGAGGDVGTAAVSGIVAANSGEYFDLRFTAGTNTKTMDVLHCHFTITKVGN